MNEPSISSISSCLNLQIKQSSIIHLDDIRSVHVISKMKYSGRIASFRNDHLHLPRLDLQGLHVLRFHAQKRYCQFFFQFCRVFGKNQHNNVCARLPYKRGKKFNKFRFYWNQTFKLLQPVFCIAQHFMKISNFWTRAGKIGKCSRFYSQVINFETLWDQRSNGQFKK